MAQPVESMDIDDDFDDKENALFRNNLQPRTPCMEKGYEELDVSELNMKLRYSMTPVSSPMSKSYTTNLVTDSQNSPVSENYSSNLTQTSIMTRSDITNKSSKLTPLPLISTDQFADNKKTSSVLRPLESAYTGDTNDIAIIVSQPNDLDDNLSLPSTSSSLVHTPEATTPTKEVAKSDGGSPIMRGIKSVLNMFRSSQSPIPPVEDAKSVARDLTSPAIEHVNESGLKTTLASTPISSQKRQNLSKGSSPLKDSVTFNEDLEKELLWKDETTIIFSKEKLPIHKLFYPQPKPTTSNVSLGQNSNQNLDSTVEYMDISYNSSMIKVPDDKKEYTVIESDSEFVDCETTLTKNESVLSENNKINVQPLDHVDLKNTVEANRHISPDELKETLVKSEPTDDRDKAVSKISMNITIDLPDTDVVKFSNSVVPNPDIKRPESGITSTLLNDKEVENNKSKIGDSKNDFESSQNKINDQSLEHVDSKNSVEANRHFSPDELKETLVKSEATDDRDKAVSKMSMNMTIDLPDTDVVKFSNAVVPNPDNLRPESGITSSTTLRNDKEVENNKSKIGDNKNDFESSQNKINDQPSEHVDLKNSVEANRHISSDELKEIIVKSMNMTIGLPDTNVLKFIDSVVPNPENDGLESGITSSTMILNDREVENIKSKIGDSKNDFELLQNKIDVHSLEHVNLKKNVESICSSAHEINETLMKSDEIHEIDETILKMPLDMTVTFPEANAGEIITSLVPVPQIKTPEIISDTMILYDGEEILTNESKVEDTSYLINENIDKNFDGITNNNVLSVSTPNVNNIFESLASEAITNITNQNFLSKRDSRITNELSLESEKCLKNSETTSKKDTHIAHVVLDETSEVENPVSIDNIGCSKPCEMESYSEQNNTQTLDSNMDRICDDEIVNLLKGKDVIVEAESSDLMDKMKICSSFTNIDKTLEKVDITFSLDHEENQMEKNVPIASGINIIIPEKNNVAASEITNVCAIPDIICDTVISSDNITSASKEKQNIIVEHNKNHLNENLMLPTSLSDEITTNLKYKTSDNTNDNQNNKNLTINTNNIIATPSDGTDCNLVTLQEIRDMNMLKPNDINEDLISTVKPLPASSNNVTLLLTNLEENQKGNINVSENKMKNNINEIITINMDKFIPTTTSVKVDNDTKNSIENQNIEIDRSNCNSAEAPSKMNEKCIEEIPCSEEEVVVSEINSPYVSISVETESKSIVDFEETVNPFITKKSNNAITLSPPIASKGYNFNFDTIDDPFATKTRLSISPSSESFQKPISEPTISKSVEKIDSVGKNLNKNRRKSQPEFRKSVNRKTKQNQSFGSVSNILQENIAFQTSNITIKNEECNFTKNNSNNCEYLQEPSISMETQTDSVMEKESNFGKNKPNLLSLTKIKNETEICILNEQTVESQDRCIEISYNTGTTSNEDVSKNVFNLPEIDDRNFNPFANKLKTSQSFEITGDLPITSIDLPNDANDDVEKTDTTMLIYNKESNVKQKQVIDNKYYENINNTTGSSTTDEKNITVKEVHTDDEDTIEGPFLEAGELDNDEILVDFQTEKVDMMNFSNVPAQVNEETGELFIDAETFDFLMNKNTNEVADSGKESLFLKFDPLFSRKANSDGVGAVLNVLQQRQSTPHKSSESQAHVTFDKSAIAGSSTFNLSHDGDVTHLEDSNIDSNNTILSKPMMVVTPAVNPVVTPRNKTITPTNTNRRSMTYTSPAMAVIDRLLSLSSNNSMVNLEATLSEEQNEADLALLELREVLAVKEDHVQQLRLESEELKDRLSGLESHLRSLEIENEEKLKRVNDLTERLNEKTQINKSMATVMEEYERTISCLISEMEQDKKLHAEERRRLINERDEQTAHLSSMEVSFSDLHSKYEKSKQVILGCKANEEVYKKSIKEFEENFDKMQSNYDLLKQHATTKLNHVNQELMKMNRAHESEVLKMNAMIKRKDLYITSLEESLAQKTKANEELTAICDELINKVG